MDLGDEISLKAAYQRLNSTHTYTEATAFRFFFFSIIVCRGGYNIKGVAIMCRLHSPQSGCGLHTRVRPKPQGVSAPVCNVCTGQNATEHTFLVE